MNTPPLDRDSSPRWLLAAVLMLGLVATPTAGQTVTWDGGGATSSWLEAANWNPNSIPTTGQAAVIVGDTATISGVMPPAIMSLTLGSATLAGGLTMTGGANPAQLTALATTTVNPAAQLSLGVGSGARSELVTGSMFVSGAVDVGARGDLVVNGTLTQTGGVVTKLSGGTLSATNVATKAGLFEAAGVVAANVKLGDGVGAQATLSPDDGVNSLTINGDLTLASDARLRLEFAVTSGGTGLRNDAIHVNGAVALGGTLDLSQLGTGTPPPGVPFTLLTATAFDPASRFDDIVGLQVGNGSWVPEFDLTNGVRYQYTVLLGDMNGDQGVDELDVEKFAWAVRDGATYFQQFVLGGGAAFPNIADMDLDGDQTFADIPLFLDAVAQGGGSVAAATATIAAILAPVPEPASGALAAAAIATLVVRRSRSRQT